MNNPEYNLKIILLAAGKSERFNGIKLLAKVQQQDTSITLIEHALHQISGALNTLNISQKNIRVATGLYHSQLSALFNDPDVLDYCEDAHLGLGHTIAQSVRHILNDDQSTSHIMIALADQVALSVDNYIALIEESVVSPTKLVCAKAGQELMPPAIFTSAYFSELTHLKGDKGAKPLLHKNKENLKTVSIPHAEKDIDTRQDLDNWHNDK
ncbi:MULTISPECIES: nucleotidyltransferase family protein [unclassified Colwellia]|uniref:nucleotidyltransferase family protein n=1 Tax=unclassified Colwellia TaxID=196834 RepID=UPI0015F44498|nr:MULTISPECIES: nucleotidyltransferase family protein [unclassified Colwellia]MBA6234433.1 nucleotidyltransferase family protein [Colwellia sp. MB02u-7]MBA6236854.1 nucleotidyltransferase family protein [Colwellia sp. MB02u-11]MBA6256203.1 nucleotidyltransferase family protein [Colwellia sp. MB3u-28]MBA6260087.1 nucleotidyltransferase family protein [Colwellia sp. MB3u-41]MBA6300006.1 nucleotidyltransferase family protein [Colwellia sp. MB3u-22]